MCPFVAMLSLSDTVVATIAKPHSRLTMTSNKELSVFYSDKSTSLSAVVCSLRLLCHRCVRAVKNALLADQLRVQLHLLVQLFE